MTTTSNVSTAPAPREPRPRTEARYQGPYRAATRVVRRRVTRTLLLAGAWFWAFWAALVVGTPFAVDRWGGDIAGLTYDAAGGPARWVAFAVGVITATALLTLHVAAGGTRRAFVDGAVRAALVGGAVFGVLSVLLSLAEERVYTVLDRPWRGPSALVDPSTPAGAVVAAAGEALVVVTYLLVGVAVLAGYRRYGAWRGTLLIPALLVPAALADLATRTGTLGILVRGLDAGLAVDTVLTLAGGAAAAALATVVAHRMLRSVPLRP
ncbi:hypothetical protein [Isoptericola sp. BMS4]|uniref:hypothetical protein n=1 Tax=Isoptericola sp. BMS4 TaxID=2527875 RepID=UPI00142378A2|nr:hypothetical protein [Isoptericola sp. BMS4]